MKTVPLRGVVGAGRFALVDDEDYDLVRSYRWHGRYQRPGDPDSGVYAESGIRRPDGSETKIGMHKLITGWPKTDHKDHNGLNNQRSNLRPATTAQNNHNQRPQRGTSSQFKGVTWHRKVGKWQAAIKINGKNRYLGLFVSERDAADAYDRAAEAEYGEYAYLNREHAS